VALGINFLFKLSKNRKLKYLFFAGATAYLGFFSYFFLRYFYLYNWQLSKSWQPGIGQMIQDIDQLSADYDFIFVEGDQLAYIHFAFYNPFPPQEFIKDAIWQKDGFEAAVEFQKYQFYNFPNWNKITLEEVEKYFTSENSQVLIVVPGKSNKKYDPTNLIYEQKDWRGRVLWEAWQIDSTDVLKNTNLLPVIK